MKKVLFLIVLLIGVVSFGVKKYASDMKIYENNNFVTLNANGTINRVEIPVENSNFINDEL